MGWISLVKLGKGTTKLPRFSKLGSLGSRISEWFQATKFSSWLKAGAAGGIGYTIYHSWSSAVSSISDATGLSEDNVETAIFLVLGCMVAYVAAKLLFPDNGSGTTVVVQDRSGSRSSSNGSASRGSRSSSTARTASGKASGKASRSISAGDSGSNRRQKA